MMEPADTVEQNASRLYTVNQFCAVNPWAKPGGIRAQIFHELENGLKEAGAIVRIGRKVLISSERYIRWVYQQNGISQSKDGQLTTPADKRSE